MATLVGKVGMVMKGDWSSSATYETLDAVGYNGGTYIAKQNVPANTAPTNTTYWQPALTNTIVSESISLNSIEGKANGTVFMRRSGSVVSLYFYNLLFTESVSAISEAIPANYRPSYVGYRSVLSKRASGATASIQISTSGNLDFDGFALNEYYYGIITYVI